MRAAIGPAPWFRQCISYLFIWYRHFTPLLTFTDQIDHLQKYHLAPVDHLDHLDLPF